MGAVGDAQVLAREGLPSERQSGGLLWGLPKGLKLLELGMGQWSVGGISQWVPPLVDKLEGTPHAPLSGSSQDPTQLPGVCLPQWFPWRWFKLSLDIFKSIKGSGPHPCIILCWSPTNGFC